jgi:cell division septum initiation protein DivIVA
VPSLAADGQPEPAALEEAALRPKEQRVDVQERLDELNVLVEDAKSMPLSASCVVNRSQVLDLIEEIRQMLPESVHRADELLADREAVVQEGRREADRILERARTEADKMVSEHEVYLAAVAEAEALRKETLSDTSRMRQETDDFIDAKLASFEITLQKTLQTVDRGRERIRSQMYEDLAPVDRDEFFDGAAEPEREDY